MRLIDADALGNRMYHESFEKDSDLQRWDSGCWIRYKLFEQVLREMPTIDPKPTHPTPSNTLGALDCIERQFEEIVVEYPDITDEEYKGKPYYSIKYVENGKDKIIGFGTYSIDVLSRYIREYFIQSVQPDKDLIHLQKEQAYMQGYEDGQKPRRGKWIRHTKVEPVYSIDGVETWGIKCQCDKCCFATTVVEGFGYYNFCPNCGCRMEEGDSE